MNLSPIDVAQQQFSRSFNGVNAREVESFLHTVAHAMTQLVQRNGEVQAQLAAQLQKVQVLESRENDVKEALVVAQRAVEEVRSHADKEAHLRIEQAEVKGQQIVAEAQERSVSLAAQVKDLVRQRTRFVEELRGLIATHARLLDLHVAEAAPSGDASRQVHTAGPSNDVLTMLQAPAPPIVVDASTNRRQNRALRGGKLAAQISHE